MPRDLDDTDPYIDLNASNKPSGSITTEKAEALMKKGTWHSGNSNSSDGKMVEYITVFKADIEALGLPLTASTQAPFGKDRQVTSWGAIHHSGNQYEVPLAVLESASGKRIEEVAPGERPKSAGTRGGLPPEPAWKPKPKLLAQTPSSPPTSDQAIALMNAGTWSEGNSHLADHTGTAEFVTVFADDITKQGLSLAVSTQKPFGLARQVTEWGAIRDTDRQFSVPLSTLEAAAGGKAEELAPRLKGKSGRESTGTTRPGGITHGGSWGDRANS